MGNLRFALTIIYHGCPTKARLTESEEGRTELSACIIVERHSAYAQALPLRLGHRPATHPGHAGDVAGILHNRNISPEPRPDIYLLGRLHAGVRTHDRARVHPGPHWRDAVPWQAAPPRRLAHRIETLFRRTGLELHAGLLPGFLQLYGAEPAPR